MLLNCCVFKKTLESPLDYKEIKPVNPKYSLEGLMLKLKLQYFGHLMARTDSLENTLMLGKTEGGRRQEWQRMRWLDGITDLMDLSLSRLRDGEGQGSLVCCSPWGHKESDTTERLNNNNNNYHFRKTSFTYHLLCWLQVGREVRKGWAQNWKTRGVIETMPTLAKCEWIMNWPKVMENLS